jgi:hypothetical protein
MKLQMPGNTEAQIPGPRPLTSTIGLGPGSTQGTSNNGTSCRRLWRNEAERRMRR